MREKQRGVWELRVYLGRDASGTVRHKSRSVHGTKREAARALAAFVTEVEAANREVDLGWGPETTVNAAIEGWRQNGWGDLSPSTVRRYTSIWNVHIKDSIGRRKIRSLGPYEVERYLRELKHSGQSESSVHQVRALLHRACRLARKWSGNRLPNPVAETDMPEWGLNERTREVRCPEVNEVLALLDVARSYDGRIAVFIRLVAATGCRRGEACALRWSDIDWDQSAITLDEGIVMGDGGSSVKLPKTRKSVRTIAIDAGTLADVAELRGDRERLAAQCGVALRPDAFVFSLEPSGLTPPYPDSMSHAFARIRKLAGAAADIHLHSLRHFHSTRLDPIIPEAQKQARLGWATVQMARHYTGPIREEDRRAAAHIGELLGQRRNGEPELTQTGVDGAVSTEAVTTTERSRLQDVRRRRTAPRPQAEETAPAAPRTTGSPARRRSTARRGIR